ncbi:MAG: Holliday junction resolvase RuvX [Bacilli bacterium]|nr:Holliday junction resolvase RuvX [Bacilli bacterium]
MRYLGLDLGTKTLGLAMTDKLGIIASPYKVLRYFDVNKLIDELIDIIHEEKVDELVLGLPKNMNNSLGFASERSLYFKELLENKIDLPIHLVDERLSTMEAENRLIFSDTRRDKRKQVIDAYAASIILETYLKSKKG